MPLRSPARPSPARPALAALCVAGLTLTAAPAAAAEVPSTGSDGGFSDTGGSVHAGAIDALATQGVLQGFDDGTFAPRGLITRGQLASVLVRAYDPPPLQAEEGEPAPEPVVLTDVAGSEHADAIQALADAGLTRGFGDGTFRPALPITRGQAVALLARVTGAAPLESDCFPDAVTSEHYGSICALAVRGVVSGDGGSFDPGDPITRGQTSSVVARSLGLVDPVGTAYTLTVLHNNDGESDLLGDGPDGDDPGAGSISRYGALFRSLATTASQGPDDGVLGIAAGDNFLASPELQASQALPEGARGYDAEALNSLPYDAFVLGNHEFDFGTQFLADFVGSFRGDTPFLSANLDFSDVPELADLAERDRIRPSVLLREDDLQVGVVGLTTPDLREVSSPGATGIDPDLAAVAQVQVDALRAEGADVVVLGSHLQDITNEQELVGELSGVDAVVGGGGGEDIRASYPLVALDADGEAVPVVTVPGDYFDVGRLVLSLDAEGDVVGFGGGLVPVTGDLPEDPTLLDRVERPVAAYLASLEAEVVATTDAPLNGVRADVRTRETNVGNLLADSFLDTVSASGQRDGDEPLVALQNGGGIRNDSLIGPGDVSVADTFDVAPFDNRVSVLEDVAAADLLAAAEHGLEALPGAAGSFGQWGGLTLTYDPAAPAGDRVRTLTLTDGTAVVVDGELVAGAPAVDVATINFLAAGNDGYDMFEAYDFTILPTSYQQALRTKLEAETSIAADDPEYGARGDGGLPPTRVVPAA